MSIFDNYKTICIYGFCDEAKGFLTLEAFEKAQYFVADEPDSLKDAAERYGKKVISPDELRDLPGEGLLILVTDKANAGVLVKKLNSLGFEEGREFIRPYHVNKKFWENFAAGEKFVWTEEFEASASKSWIRRTKIMLDMLPEKPGSVLDIGAGNQYLKDMLPSGTRYLSMDGDAAKNPDYVYDFNSGEKIDVAEVDYAFAAGAFEYIKDLPAFLDMILPRVKKGIVLSYHPLDFYSDIIVPRSELWNNAFTVSELILMLRSYGFFLSKRYENAPQVIYMFDRIPDGIFAQKKFLGELIGK